MLAAAAAFEQPVNEGLVYFDTAAAQARQMDGAWKVVADGDKVLHDFGPSEESARKAVAVINHYGMNCMGYVGKPNPSMEFFLGNGGAPAGPWDGEDAIRFNPATAEARCIQGRWKVVDGELWMMDFEDRQKDAEFALSTIKKFGFTHLCFVGRCVSPRPMMYFRIDGQQAAKPAPVVAVPKPATPKPAAPAGAVATGKARLRVTVLEGKDAMAVNPAVSLSRAGASGEALEIRTENPAVFEAEAGTCAVSAKVGTGEATAPREIALKTGETKELTLRAGTGTAEINLSSGGQPVSPCPNIELRAGGRLLGAASQSPARFQVPEGIYTVRVVVNSSQPFEGGDVAVTAGETAVKSVELPMGTLSVRVMGGPYGPGGKMPYVEVDAGGRLVAALVDIPAKFQLLAGQYDVCVVDDGAKKGTQPITVEAGKVKEVTLTVP